MEHQPVLLAEVLEFLAVPGISLLVDCTIGAGGHAGAFLKSQGGAGSESGSEVLLAQRLTALERPRSKRLSAGGEVGVFWPNA